MRIYISVDSDWRGYYNVVMMGHKIHEWRDIRDRFTENLLLGNGASIAVHEDFSYPSLYEKACQSGVLSEKLQELFRHFGTTNFEVLLRLLLNAKLINESLGVDESETTTAYRAVKDALVSTVIDVHPRYDDIETLLLRIAEYLKGFKRVFCLNYDLVVYWAMRAGNDEYGLWFKDGFIDDGGFSNDYGFLYEPHYTAEGSTLVFYPHGSLFLATDFWGNEVKLSRSGDDCLLETISSKWGKGDEIEDYVPLFVTEGKTREKLSRMRRSNYLDTVYDTELSKLDESLVIYGWSIGGQDAHILDALAEGNLKDIAISVHMVGDNWQRDCDECEEIIRRKQNLDGCAIYFFDAKGVGCWIH